MKIISKISVGFAVLGLMGCVAPATTHQKSPLGEDDKKAKVVSFWSEDEFSVNMKNSYKYFDSVKIKKPPTPTLFTVKSGFQLPPQFGLQDTSEFLKKTQTKSLIVIQDNKLHLEYYSPDYSRSTQGLAFSVTKSIISLLIGRALADGHISSLDDSASKYVPELKGTSFEDVKIKDLLTMSSGVKFHEDYNDVESDINAISAMVGYGGNFLDYAKSLSKGTPSGVTRSYSSYDTFIASVILSRATGTPLSDYFYEVLWKPIGAQYDAYWLIDDSGFELSWGGLSVTPIDLAKIGALVANKGCILAGSISTGCVVSSNWIDQSVNQYSRDLKTDLLKKEFGYGFQWWRPDDSSGEFFAAGIYGQYIYISPATKTVIVKVATDSGNVQDDFERTQENISFFREIIKLTKR